MKALRCSRRAWGVAATGISVVIFALSTLPCLILGRLARALWHHFSRAKRSVVEPRGEEGPSILVVKVDGIGDFILCTPLFSHFRRRYPAGKLTLVASREIRSFVETCPYVDHYLLYDRPSSGFLRALLAAPLTVTFAARHLWGSRFDFAVVPRWDFDSRHATYLAYLSLADEVWGFSEGTTARRSIVCRGFDRMLTHCIPSNPKACHEVERTAEVIKALCGPAADRVEPELWLTEEDRRYARSLVSGTASGLVCLGIGAGHPKRRYPLERFGVIARAVAEATGVAFLIVGDEQDYVAGEWLRRQFSLELLNAAGRTSLRESAALLELCSMYIGNDSGPMHLAAAVNTGVVEISCHPAGGVKSSVNSPHRFGPWAVDSTVLQPLRATGPCQDECLASAAHCILEIPAEAVQEAALRMLEQAVTSRVCR